MAEVDEKIITDGVKLFEERFNALFANALIRTDEVEALCDAVPGMEPHAATIWLFFKMVPRMLESTPHLSEGGRIALGNTLVQELREVIAGASNVSATQH